MSNFLFGIHQPHSIFIGEDTNESESEYLSTSKSSLPSYYEEEGKEIELFLDSIENLMKENHQQMKAKIRNSEDLYFPDDDETTLELKISPYYYCIDARF